MKTTFTLITIITTLLINGDFLAQPSLSNTNLPSAGESYTIFTNTSLPAGSNAGDGGANVSWDFSSIGTTNSNPLTYFANTNGTYPNADVFFETQGTNNYFEVSNNAFTYFGSNNSSIDIVYTDGQDQLRVPFNFGDQYTDSYAGSISAFSQTYDRTGNVEVTADGYGTLETPEGVYSNVMRVRIIRSSEDTNNGTPVSNQLDTIYFWYDQYTPHPLMTYSINYVDGSETGRFANYMADSDVAALVKNEELSSLKVYPNPASGKLTVNSDEILKSLKVYGTDGREILELKPTQNTTQINLQSLTAGTYYLQYERYSGGVGQKIFIKQ